MSLFGDIAGVASDALDIVDKVGDLAGEAAPIVGMFNPVAGLALGSLSQGTNLLEGLTKGIVERHENEAHGNVRDHRSGKGGGCDPKPGCGDHKIDIGNGPFWHGPLIIKPPCDGGHGGGKGPGKGEGVEGGGSIFEQIALAMGKAMDKKLDQLLDAANEVSALSDKAPAKPGAAGADAAGGAGGAGKTGGKDGEGSAILQASAQVTARGQELNSISQAFNSSINSLGNAVSTAARKQ